MRFKRHLESINPMWSLILKPGRETASLTPGPTTPHDPVRGQDHTLRSTPGHRARPSYEDVSRGARPAHRLDEFQPVIPRSGCSPAEPVSASPVTVSIKLLPDRMEEFTIEW
jgi:hypothetical protein